MVIDAIEGEENKARKDEMKRRYDIYRDYTKKFVLEKYRQDQGQDAVNDVFHRTSNISFLRKIIDKKSMIYKEGARREVTNVPDPEKTQKQIDQVIDLLNWDSRMKKVNKWVELFRNTSAQIMPYKNFQTEKLRMKLNVYEPFKYDAIEDADNPEDARVYMFSYYTKLDQSSSGQYAPQNESSIHPTRARQLPFREGDLRDQTIADAPDDFSTGNKEYVWWSTNYHFTTSGSGEIIEGKQEEDLKNAIKQLNFVNFNKEQDGQFWAIGGEDLVDGAINLNVFLTDLFYITKFQGMGLFYFFGKGVPKNIKVGPAEVLTLDMEEGDPTPQVGFASANPPISEHMDNIIRYLIMLLTTNNLNPGDITADINSASSASSGIQEIIQRSDILEDLEDQQEMYRDKEPQLFRIYAKWHNKLLDKGVLDDDFAKIGKIDENLKVVVKFNPPRVILSEKEKLEIIDIRKELNLDTAVDSIIRDNPELTDVQAEEKLVKILEAKAMESRKKIFSLIDEAKNGEQSNIQNKPGPTGSKEQERD